MPTTMPSRAPPWRAGSLPSPAPHRPAYSHGDKACFLARLNTCRSHGRMTRNHVDVLKELAAHAGQDGRINPSKATLAERTELGERTVARALDAARGAHLVRWDRQRKHKWGSWQSVQTSNSYEILVPPEWQSPEIITRRSGGQIGRGIAEPSALLLSVPVPVAEWEAMARQAALAQARSTVAWLEGAEDSS